MIILNVGEEPAKVKHICFFTREGDDSHSVELYEVIEAFYRHPQAPDAALIQRYETRFVRWELRTSLEGGALVVLEACQKTLAQVEHLKREN